MENIENIQGNPYLMPDFQKGQIVMKDSTVIDDVALRYNIYTDRMEFYVVKEFQNKEKLIEEDGNLFNVKVEYVPKDTFSISKPYEIKEVRIGTRRFLYLLALKQKTGNQFLTSGYFEIIADGKCQLLIKREINVDVHSFVPYYAGGGGDGRNYFAKYNKVYVRTGSGAAVKIGKNRKDVLKFMEDKKEEMRAYIKNEKIVFKKYADLVKVFMYYNEITNG
ncbi:MAG: hypothetical protein K8S18_16770 [Desulfobacula sp.]|nr:hypothetical protein [Desulfobacula sp.]